MSIMPAVLGTIPGWITAGSAVSGLGIYLRFVIQSRRLHGDRLDALEKENRQLRFDFDKYRKDCIEESDRQRALIAGLRKQLIHIERRGLAAMPLDKTPATKARFGERP